MSNFELHLSLFHGKYIWLNGSCFRAPLSFIIKFEENCKKYARCDEFLSINMQLYVYICYISPIGVPQLLTQVRSYITGVLLLQTAMPFNTSYRPHKMSPVFFLFPSLLALLPLSTVANGR